MTYNDSSQRGWKNSISQNSFSVFSISRVIYSISVSAIEERSKINDILL